VRRVGKRAGASIAKVPQEDHLVHFSVPSPVRSEDNHRVGSVGGVIH
jgi:hypothetical protein